MPRPVLALLAVLLVTSGAGCRSKPADEQTLRDLGATTTSAVATTSTRAPEPDEEGPPTTRPTTSSAKGSTTTSGGPGSSALTQLTGDVVTACEALRTVTELDDELRRVRPTSLDEIQARFRRAMPPTLDAYDRAIAAVGPDTAVGRELQDLRDGTETLYQAYLRATTLEQASDVPLDEAGATGQAAGATFALNDAVKASCGFPLSSQLG